MRLFLMVGGLVAAALIAACEKENNGPTTAHLPEQPLQPNRNFRTTFTIRNPGQEVTKIGRLLFEGSGRDWRTVTASQALAQRPGRNQGLNAYTRGIINGDRSYYYHEAQTLYANQLSQLQGIQYYLSGHMGCPSTNMQDPNRINTCIKINDGRDIPSVYDSEDDYDNLMGMFFKLRADLNRFTAQTSCTIGIATLGSDESPFCQTFTMHNIVLTPVALFMRGASEALAQGECSHLSGGVGRASH